jgi:hypothetical protein
VSERISTARPFGSATLMTGGVTAANALSTSPRTTSTNSGLAARNASFEACDAMPRTVVSCSARSAATTPVTAVVAAASMALVLVASTAVRTVSSTVCRVCSVSLGSSRSNAVPTVLETSAPARRRKTSRATWLAIACTSSLVVARKRPPRWSETPDAGYRGALGRGPERNPGGQRAPHTDRRHSRDVDVPITRRTGHDHHLTLRHPKV